MNPFTQLIGLTMFVHLFVILVHKGLCGYRAARAKIQRKRTTL